MLHTLLIGTPMGKRTLLATPLLLLLGTALGTIPLNSKQDDHMVVSVGP